jgi:hypothetical protein
MDLAARSGTNAEIKSQGRRKTQRKTNLGRRLVGFGAIATVIAYFARRPTLIRVAVSLVVVFAGLGIFQYLQLRHPPKNQAGSETPRESMPISPRTTTGDVRKDSRTVSTTSNARRDDEAPTPARAPAEGKLIVAQRDPALEKWFIKSYLRCWTPPSTLPEGERYAAQVRVVHNLDGSLSIAPVLVNPPIDPEWRAYADSAVRAVTKCNPLQVPPRYLSQFEQWRKMTLYFSPDTAL